MKANSIIKKYYLTENVEINKKAHSNKLKHKITQEKANFNL